MPRHRPAGLPSREQILEFLRTSPHPAGKREIAKAFGLKGDDKLQLKRLLRDMAEEGLIDGNRTAFRRAGGVPRVTVLRIVDTDEEGWVAVPDTWESTHDGDPPRIRIAERGTDSGRKRASTPPLKRGDRVLAHTEQSGNTVTARVMKRLPPRAEGLIGVVETDSAGRLVLAPVSKRVRDSVPIGDAGGARVGELVLAERTGRSARGAARVVEVVGDPLAPNSFSLIAIAEHDIPHSFPPAALAEAEAATVLPLCADEREDLRHLPLVAIDPRDARDHDDAIWAEAKEDGGFRAVVAIADVSYYVRPGGALDREARRRGNSVYFPDRVVPMLPEVLSADVCSLVEGEDRAVMACHLDITAEGRIAAWRFSRGLARLAANIAYEDAQAAIDAGAAGAELRALWACWRLLHAARVARGPLELDLPERRVVLDEGGGIADIVTRERLDAHQVVEDFMIAANVAAARALEAKTSPVVYRVHEPPSREKLLALREFLATQGRSLALGQVVTPALFNRMLKDIADDTERALVMQAVLRSQTQAYYGPANAGHFGLSLASYAHFTSPIRRYADLLVHRALVDAYGLEQSGAVAGVPQETGLSARDRASLASVSEAISATERRAMEAERDTIDRYVAAWLAGRVGEEFDTRITGVQFFGFFATITGVGGDGLVPVSTLGDEFYRFDEAAQALVGADSGRRFTVGDRLRLRLVESNPLTGGLRFALPDAETADADAPLAAARSGQARRGARPERPRRGRPGNIRHQGRRR
ncbi:ribonuclease R [Erythrobacteraceae bacterium CFH 75059]|uniref:ribonuclease R n=1 Tax=Qipengyuania thermophila TaxID=2509361 RepID=UPI0010204A57|nr:ribonuclease R [Qipengyuania thermophila]TCD05195.1 ribonuclease R [Erythrobacteraceae bacterium CFH 75059]